MQKASLHTYMHLRIYNLKAKMSENIIMKISLTIYFCKICNKGTTRSRRVVNAFPNNGLANRSFWLVGAVLTILEIATLRS